MGIFNPKKIITKTLFSISILTALSCQAEDKILATSRTQAGAALNIDNPIVLQRADPWILRDASSGCYHFIGTSPKFDQIEIRGACRLNDLKLAEPKVIWRKHEQGTMGANIWAPELHQIDGTWYVYFAAGDADDPWHIRMYVLANDQVNPSTGEWRELGQIKTPVDSFSLDATTFVNNGKRYLLWAQQNLSSTDNSSLFMAEMDSPSSITGAVVMLSEPTLEWETQGYRVNEGAAVLIRHGRVFITYSASATDDRYAMGMLWADADSDLLSPASWHKTQQAIFASNENVGRFGPGHNSFTLAEDGVTDLMIYHSRDYLQLKGSPLTDPNRHARARPVYWDAQGFPVFFSELAD